MIKHIFCFSLFLFISAMLTLNISFAAAKGFYPDGQLKWEYSFDDGELSEAKWYNESGQLVTREVYTAGQPQVTEGYRPDGSVEWQARTLEENRKEVTRFNEAGQKTALYQTLDNQPDGEYSTFYEDGTPKQTVNYQMGVLEGPARTFFPSGQVEHEYTYKNGEIDGTYKTYSEEGTLLTEYTFSAGTIQ